MTNDCQWCKWCYWFWNSLSPGKVDALHGSKKKHHSQTFGWIFLFFGLIEGFLLQF